MFASKVIPIRRARPAIAPRAFAAIYPPYPIYLLCSLCALVLLGGCKASPVLLAERSAPVGNEFIRLFPDGHAEYGYVVVKENLKAQGGYRYANDTVWFPDEAFKAHFPAGYLPIKEGVLYMESGLHFKIKSNELK